MFASTLFFAIGECGRIRAGQIYWAEPTLGKIMRAGDDGTGVREVLADVGFQGTFAMDVVGRKLYWVGSPAGYGVYRSNPDGTQIEKLVASATAIDGITVDAHVGRVFWSDHAFEYVFSAGLDGSDVRTEIIGFDKSQSLAVDAPNGCLYLVQGTGVHRAAVASESCEPSLVADRYLDGLPWRIALDVPSAILYWSERDHSLPANGFGSIRRIRFDGTGMETIIASPLDPDTGFRVFGIALDLNGERIYWTERSWERATDGDLLFNTPRIRRANLDGTNIEDLGISGIESPDTIVFDPIPEPASILLLLIGCGSFFAAGRLRPRSRRATV